MSRAVRSPPARDAARPAPPAAGTSDIAARVVAWQRIHGRHALPWQRTRDAYRVWLSEIMLQQTQVTTVLAYYARFLERFPDVAALARAPLDDVLAAWSGLGYYSRARNLHRCAQAVVEQHGGCFPASAEQLAALPGIGRSTAAAIAAFCFDERAAILDGNVKRVLTRRLGVGADLAVARHERALWAQAETLLPDRAADMPAYTQGLMDLGATVCLARRPNCLLCPLADDCVAHREGRPDAYPVKSRTLRRTTRENWWLWLAQGDRVWLQQRPPRGVWAGLWSLPLFDDEPALAAAAARLGVPVEPQPLIRHALTHFQWTLHPRLAQLDGPADPAAVLGAGRWADRAERAALGLPAPLRKLLDA